MKWLLLMFSPVLIGTLVFAGSVSAATLDVPAQYPTIQAAVNAANLGDTINVAAGTYNENAIINKSVNLIGAGADVTIVNAPLPYSNVFKVTADWVNISGFTVTGARTSSEGEFMSIGGVGIILSKSSYSKIENVNVLDNYIGVRLYFSSNNTLTNNTANSNTAYGIMLTSSSGNNIKNNTANSNSYYGMYLLHSSGNILSNNTAKENSVRDIFIGTGGSNAYCSNIVQSNTGSGDRPIKYFNYSVSLQDEVLSELILCNADNSSINNVTIEGSATKKNNGLFIDGTDYSNFTNINLSNKNGIYLFFSSNNTLTDSIVDSSGLYGIYIIYSNNNVLTNNSVLNNRIGIHVTVSSNNTIYHNNFINNMHQASDYANTTWHNGGGNYWSDYDTPAEGCKDANSDGFCDDPYYFIGGTDYLPWTNQSGWISTENMTPLTLPITMTSPEEEEISMARVILALVIIAIVMFAAYYYRKK